MIQRIQSVYLLLSMIMLSVFFFVDLGTIETEPVLTYSAVAFEVMETDEVVQENYFLSGLLFINLAVLFVCIFLFKNRSRQMMFVQISLVLMLAFAVLALLYIDIFGLILNGNEVEAKLQYNWNVILLTIPWILTYLALRAIRKDEALVRSTDRLR